MIICGIDPGKTGALAFMRSDPAQLMSVTPMPIAREAGRRTSKTKKMVNWWAVCAAIREAEPDLLVIERQGARPGQGISSTFSIGFQYGALLGIASCLGIPYEVVEPSVWKRAMGLTGLDKDASRHRAAELMPEGAAFFTRQLDHGRAEACLIALWKLAYERPRAA
jgi:crossover junction endodeoxyribonuclease RuvC